HFYATSTAYYSNIEYAGDTWLDERQLEAQDILREAPRHEKILEIGCGRASILKSGKIDPRCYIGIDISREVIAKNRQQYPEATFRSIDDLSRFPIATADCDYVFSH